MSLAEFKVMEAAWNYDRDIVSNDVISLLHGEWKNTTVIAFMNRLQKKGYFKSEKRGKERYFTILISKEDYLKNFADHIVNEYYGGSADLLREMLDK